MENEIIRKAETYVRELLEEGLTKDHLYHDLAHTLSVRDASLWLGKKYRLRKEELELLELAALFHDTGFVKSYENHEDTSKKLAEAFLSEENYPEEKIQKVKDLIEVTRLGNSPDTLIEKILKDSDFNTNGNSYIDKSLALRHEWKVFRGVEMSENEWLDNNMDFWTKHEFYTGEGQAMFGGEKRKTLKKLKKQTKKAGAKGDLQKSETKGQLDFAINSSKAAQMMFKTTLRNQIDLTNIADNKANIMLTINSALITIGIPLIAGQLDTNPCLVFPAVTLLLTCILSIVFATLATRPVKMRGITDLEQVEKGNTNLFFFGNFFKMSPKDYREGLKKVVESDELLDKTIVNDLYYLGISLGRKYSRLHTTYSIFMVGMVVTVVVYAVSMWLSK